MLAALILLQAAAPGWPWVGAADPPAHVLKLGATEVAGRWAGRPARVRFTQVVLPGCRDANWLRGAVPDAQGRCIRLGRLEVTVAGRAIALSPGGYADLGGAKDVVVRFAPARLFIYLRGPDGPDYYGATLEIDRRDIVRRRLDLADGATEVTSYHAGAAAGL